MKVTGREHAEWGFKKPSDGWHIVEMGEGIDVLKDKEGVIAKDAKGNTLYKFPAKINDEKAEDHEVDISQIIAETAFGEQKIADILAGIGEFDNFNKAFPGDRSFFESTIMDKIKVKLPGKILKMKTETSKDGKYSNVTEIAGIKYNPDDKKDGKGKGKPHSDKPAETTSTSAAATGNDW